MDDFMKAFAPDNLDDTICRFLEAQQKAEQKGDERFDCPICGGDAVWSRSAYNNHLHAGCAGCGFKLME